MFQNEIKKKCFLIIKIHQKNLINKNKNLFKKIISIMGGSCSRGSKVIED